MNFLLKEFWGGNLAPFSQKYEASVFNIDNNQKHFCARKSAYYYDFWRSCDTED